MSRFDGTIFTVAKEDCKIEQSLKKGDVVSYTYEGFSRFGVPIAPKIFRLQTDMNWKDIISKRRYSNGMKRKLVLLPTLDALKKYISRCII